jgi:hypothetical protein
MSTNPNWNFFEKVVDPSKAKCKECEKVYSLGSDKNRLQTVSGLKSHLAKCHPDINSAYLKRLGEKQVEVPQCKKIKIESCVERSFVQPTVAATLDRKLSFADDSHCYQSV